MSKASTRNEGGQAAMRGLKRHLPVKACASCGRPMAWRKRWARVWDEVRHCSDACRRRRSRADPAEATGG